MARLTINGQSVEVEEQATVLEAARAANVQIPTLCHCRETGPLTSCMLCVVKNAATGDTLLACASPAADGMDIVTDDEEVHTLRRETLALLLAEHAGDCEGPCERACPAGLRIPQVLRALEAGDQARAAAIAREDLLFPALLGRVCAAPCERICRRGQYDEAVTIRACHGGVAEAAPPSHDSDAVAASGKSVVVIGGGLAGLAAARVCVEAGHACCVYEREDRLCPGLSADVPADVRHREFAFLQAQGVTVCTGTEKTLVPDAAGSIHAVQALLDAHDAVIVAVKGADALDDARVVLAPEEKMPVRAVAAGKRAGRRVNALLGGGEYHDRRPFNSHLGRLQEEDLEAYGVGRITGERAHPAADSGAMPELSERAARCLHCDCLKPTTCKLRQYADEYKVTLGGKRNLPPRTILPMERCGNIVFEPGKCIKCGICIALTRNHGIRPGMAITGRGIKSHVRAALGAMLEAGLGDAAEACVRACPTAALAFDPSS